MDIAPYGEAIAKGSELLNGILKRVLPEKISESESAKLEHELTLALMKGELDPVMAQLRINANEAQSESLFVAGWRPAVGWTCAAAFFYNFIFQPFLVFGLTTAGVAIPALPALDMGALMTILLGMLGVAGARTYEKTKGAAAVKTGR